MMKDPRAPAGRPLGGIQTAPAQRALSRRGAHAAIKQRRANSGRRAEMKD